MLIMRDLTIQNSLSARKILNPWVAEFCEMPVGIISDTLIVADKLNREDLCMIPTNRNIKVKFMKLDELIQILCLEVAIRIRGKTLEEIKELFKNVKRIC